MGTVRNFIHIIGITPYSELPSKINGQIVQYSDIETLHIPNNNPSAKSIYEVMIKLKLNESKKISLSTNNILLIDGSREYKIIYISEDSCEEAKPLTLYRPFNTFVELPKEVNNIRDINIYILDAYFDLISNTDIYSYTLYLVTVEYDLIPSKCISNKDTTINKINHDTYEFQYSIEDD